MYNVFDVMETSVSELKRIYLILRYDELIVTERLKLWILIY